MCYKLLTKGCTFCKPKHIKGYDYWVNRGVLDVLFNFNMQALLKDNIIVSNVNLCGKLAFSTYNDIIFLGTVVSNNVARCARFSPDGRYLASASADTSIKLSE
nr:hypothetical protein [Tanacetum cinerariifolium]